MNHRTCRTFKRNADPGLSDAYEQIKSEFDSRTEQLDELRKQLDEVQDRITFLKKRAEPLATEFSRLLNETQSLYEALHSLSKYGAGPSVKVKIKVPDLVHAISQYEVVHHPEPDDDENPFMEDIPF